MIRNASLVFLTVASLAILVVFLLPDWPAGGVVFVLFAACFPVALMALGAQRQGQLGPVAPVLAVLLVVLLGSAIGMLLLRGQVESGPWLWGLPLAATLQLFGLFLLPLIVVSFGYAWTFERWGVRDDELASLRQRFGRPEPIEGSRGEDS